MAVRFSSDALVILSVACVLTSQENPPVTVIANKSQIIKRIRSFMPPPRLTLRKNEEMFPHDFVSGTRPNSKVRTDILVGKSVKNALCATM